VARRDDPNQAAATLIVAAYDDAAEASAACETVAGADDGDPVAAVVTRAADGKLDATTVGKGRSRGAAAGAAAGAAVGAVLGPGVVATAAAGALVGAVRDKRGPMRPVLDAIENTLPPNSAGVVIVTATEGSERFDAALRGSRRVTKSGIDERTLEHLRKSAG
jgi:uncharacterized membrane protein